MCHYSSTNINMSCQIKGGRDDRDETYITLVAKNLTQATT